MERALALALLLIGLGLIVAGLLVAITTSYDTGRLIHIATGLLLIAPGVAVVAVALPLLRARDR